MLVTRGTYKGREGKVTQVYRKKYVIHIERVHREKTNGATVPIGIHPSNVIITKIKTDKDRTALLERKSAAKGVKKDSDAMQEVSVCVCGSVWSTRLRKGSWPGTFAMGPAGPAPLCLVCGRAMVTATTTTTTTTGKRRTSSDDIGDQQNRGRAPPAFIRFSADETTPHHYAEAGKTQAQ